MTVLGMCIWIAGVAGVWAQPGPPPAAAAAPARPPGLRDAMAKQKESIGKQRESVRHQAESAGNWMYPFEDPKKVETPCEPMEQKTLANLVDSASKAQKLEPELIRAVIDQESGSHPCAMSNRGAKGLMQLMPETADQFSVRDPFDPRQNVEAGAALLKQLLERYGGDVSQALAAYNAGPRRVDEAGGVPDIPETRDYVESILGKLKARDPPEDPKAKPPAK